jgi:F420-dependent oxidoreductase-like protein
MKLGVQIADYAWEGGPAGMAEMLARIARTVDEAGFDVIGVADHLWQGAHLGGPEQPELECFTTLGVVATHTRRCRLVPLVAGVHFRQPALLAKMVTTLDVLSGGRAMLGIGAGWYEEEARGLGFPFPPLAERFEMLDEAIQICLRMWQGERGDERPFAGKHYQLERPLNVPQSLARPHPPILIGGSGERKTLRLVARYADACNLYPTPDLPAKLDVLRRHCAAENRDFDTIEKTCMVHFAIAGGDAKRRELIAELQRLGGLGIETVIGILSRVDPIASLETIRREVLPAVAEA